MRAIRANSQTLQEHAPGWAGTYVTHWPGDVYKGAAAPFCLWRGVGCKGRARNVMANMQSQSVLRKPALYPSKPHGHSLPQRKNANAAASQERPEMVVVVCSAQATSMA